MKGNKMHKCANCTDNSILQTLSLCSGITWDECHKIYILMDEGQVDQMYSYGYNPIITSAEMSSEEMLETLKEWYVKSCGLRFISAVATKAKDGGDRFTELLAQGENWDGLDEEGDDN